MNTQQYIFAHIITSIFFSCSLSAETKTRIFFNGSPHDVTIKIEYRGGSVKADKPETEAFSLAPQAEQKVRIKAHHTTKSVAKIKIDDIEIAHHLADLPKDRTGRPYTPTSHFHGKDTKNKKYFIIDENNKVVSFDDSKSGSGKYEGTKALLLKKK